MATTTTNLRLKKPEVGADSDVWGGYWNDNADALDALLNGVLYGLTLSTAGSSTTFAVAAGGASGMVLASSISKTTGSWSVGSTNGSLDTGTVANSTWYHVWLIQRVDTGVVDVLTSLSATAPTMPANYTIKRRIGSMKTNGSAQWTAFSQNGDEFLWLAPVGDADTVTPANTSAASLTLTVPTGVKVDARFTFELDWVSGAPNGYISSLDQTDISTGFIGPYVTTDSQSSIVDMEVRTNTSAQIRVRFNATTCVYYCYTNGWRDSRGRNG